MASDIPQTSNRFQTELATEVADLLVAVTHRLRREARNGLVPDGVTGAQMRAMRALLRLPAPSRMSALADELRIARRSATSLVDELESRRLVARGHDTSDRRAVTVEVTATGQQLLSQVRERRQRTAIGMLGTLSEKELQTLRDLLDRIIE